MAERVSVLLTEEAVDARIKEIGEQVTKDYAGKEVHLICVLKGGVFFMCELAKRIDVKFQTVDRYYKNRVVRYDSYILDRICTALNCKLCDIIEYTKDTQFKNTDYLIGITK